MCTARDASAVAGRGWSVGPRVGHAALKTPCYLRYSKNYKQRHAPQWDLKYVNDLVMYYQPLVVEDQAAYDARVREIGEDGLIVLGVVSLMDGDGQACEAALFSSDSISPCEAVA